MKKKFKNNQNKMLRKHVKYKTKQISKENKKKK